jgi:hypothetical protein
MIKINLKTGHVIYLEKQDDNTNTIIIPNSAHLLPEVRDVHESMKEIRKHIEND